MDIKKTPEFNQAFEEWNGKGEVPIKQGEGIVAALERWADERTAKLSAMTDKDLEDYFEMIAKKRREQPIYEFGAGFLLSLPDKEFAMFYNAEQVKCYCSTDGYNKIQWRAYKLKLITEYKPI